MMTLLFLRLLAGVYAGLAQWWLAMLDGVVTREEKRAIARAVLVPESRAVPVARETVAEILRG